MATGDLTPEIVRSLLAYDPESGQFTWIKRRGTRTDLDGNIAGSLTNEGYWKITVAGRHFLAHRLVFMHVLGRWPVGLVDHINGNRTDNRFINLREANDELNAQNRRRARTGNSSGLLGVSVNTGRGKRWLAQIQVSGKKMNLGYFDCKYEAHAAYLEAKRRLHVACTI